MGGFSSSITHMPMKPDKFSIKFGFLLVTHTMFRVSKFTWERIGQTVSYFEGKVLVILLFGLVERPP